MILDLLVVALGLIALVVWAGRGPARGGLLARAARALVAVFFGIRTAASGTPTETMSAAQARSLLGVGENADRSEIEAAYRRLMQRAHPDRGGTAGLAAQLNAARDRLLEPRKS